MKIFVIMVIGIKMQVVTIESRNVFTIPSATLWNISRFGGFASLRCSIYTQHVMHSMANVEYRIIFFPIMKIEVLNMYVQNKGFNGLQEQL